LSEFQTKVEQNFGEIVSVTFLNSKQKAISVLKQRENKQV